MKQPKEGWPELAAYLVGAFLLIVVGAIVRTPLLNWISGPTFVIVTVCVLTPIFRRRADRRANAVRVAKRPAP